MLLVMLRNIVMPFANANPYRQMFSYTSLLKQIRKQSQKLDTNISHVQKRLHEKDTNKANVM